jgi:hypothetical protein
MISAREFFDDLQRGGEANFHDKYRKGNLIELSSPGRVIMTGDLHGHQRNFDRLVRYADLQKNPNTHLVFHEVIHNGHPEVPGEDHTFMMLAQVAKLKVRFPDQVHFLMGNHEMAQCSGEEVLKGGHRMLKIFTNGLHAIFQDHADMILQAISDFLLTLPIAIRTENRIWMSHSLPSNHHLLQFDTDIFRELLSLQDISHNKSLRALLWDRRHDEACLSDLMQRWHVDMFIVGHQSQEYGHGRPLDEMIILASDHNHGHCLPFDLSVDYTSDALYGLIKPLASIA